MSHYDRDGHSSTKDTEKDRIHPLRERCKRRRELIQIDGSYRAWLENRAENDCLLLFVDVATSAILAATFVTHQSYWAYTALSKRYFRQFGLPGAFYADRFNVYRVNHTNVTNHKRLNPV